MEEDSSSERQSLLTPPEGNVRAGTSPCPDLSQPSLDQAGGGRNATIEEEPDENVKLL